MTAPTDDLDLAREPELAHAADVLSRSLVRFHPSFRFEEDLAARLRRTALVPGVAAPVAAFPTISSAALRADRAPQRRIPALPVAIPFAGSLPVALDVAPAAVGQAMARVPRPVLVGGAIASGVSLAGAVVVAWRHGLAAPHRARRDG